MKSEMTIARDGELLREHGKKYFVVVAEALDIGRFKWSIVPIGMNGKDALVFYMTVEQMWMLVNDVKTGVFQKKMAASTQDKYPQAYKYVTGADGHLRLNMSGGQFGVRVQIQDAKANKNYMMSAAMSAFEIMAYRFETFLGVHAPAPGGYYASIVAAFEEGRKKRASYHKNIPQDALEAPETVVDDDSATADVAAEQNDNKQKESTEATKYVVTITKPKTQRKEFYSFSGHTKDDEKPVTLLFKMTDVPNIPWFNNLEKSIKKDGSVTIGIYGHYKDGFILYDNDAK